MTAMSTVQTNITLGTAGHIDHGKTALIKCLTGCETDRLKAEKERGMSIELGFAPCLISGMEVGIVDVPGHENFIKTMVAGATGIDGVIFVVAADDGVMPQTREHLDILTLLGVSDGIVALTKADCVEADHLENMRSEVKGFLEGTFLQDAQILPVSSITGQGFNVLLDELKELVGRIEPKKFEGVFRMPVERAFSLKGYGTVVSGIPVSGSVKTGQEAVLLPQGVKGRIKAIQVYSRDSDTAVCGQCAAFNIAHLDHKIISRGNVLTVGEYFRARQWYLCKLRALSSMKGAIKTGSSMKFHTGTSEVLATIFLMEGNNMTASQESLIQVKLSEGIVAGPGDRFILRSFSPVQTVGGGIIVEALGGKLRRSRDEVQADIRARAKAVTVQKDFVEYCVRTAETLAAGEAELALRVKLPFGPLRAILAELLREGKIIDLASKLWTHSDTAADVKKRLIEIVRRFHAGSPESPGITHRQLWETSGIEKNVFDGIVKLMTAQGQLVERKHRLALPEHRESFNAQEQKLLDVIESAFRDRAFNSPKLEELVALTGSDERGVEKTLRILIEQERLVQAENLLFHCEAVKRARGILVSFLEEEGRLESVKFKYLLGTTRKFALPLLDYFDRIGVTRRVGNTRYLKTGIEES